MTELQVPIRIKRGVGGPPSSLLRGELAYYEGANRLYIGSGDSGTTDAGGRPIATTVEELLAPAQFLSALADVVLASGPNDGDVLTWSVADDAWIAQAVASASVAWADITGKPSVFTPDTHTHAWGDITSGVPSTFAPSTHASSHATGGADALSPSDIGAIPSSEKGANSGVATLDAGGKLNTAQLPNLAITSFLGNAANEAAMLALTGQEGDWAIRTDSGAVWIITGATPSNIGSWTQLSYPAAPVASVNGDTGTVVLDHTDVGAAPSSHTHSASDIISGLATVATTGAYSDLGGTPTLGTAAAAATSDFVAASAASTFGLSILDDADASAARTTLGLGSAATSATSDFAAASHTHVANDITNLADVAKTGEYSSLLSIPSTFTPSAHNHTVKQELSGFIEAPEAKTYVLSPSTNAAMTITQLKAQTSAGTVDLKIQDDGADVTGATLADAGTTLASLASDISVSVAAGSKLTLVVSDPQSSPADLAFTVHYTIASENN